MFCFVFWVLRNRELLFKLNKTKQKNTFSYVFVYILTNKSTFQFFELWFLFFIFIYFFTLCCYCCTCTQSCRSGRQFSSGQMQMKEIINAYTYCALPQTGRAYSESPSERWGWRAPASYYESLKKCQRTPRFSRPILLKDRDLQWMKSACFPLKEGTFFFFLIKK